MINAIIYILECGHVMPGPVGVAETLCFDHDSVQKITGVHVYEWQAKCTAARCTFSRWCGLSQGIAGFMANQHSSKHPSHGVKVLYGINPAAQKAQDKLN